MTNDYTPFSYISPDSNEPPHQYHKFVAASHAELFSIGDDYSALTPTLFGGLTLGNGSIEAFGNRIQGRMLSYGCITLGSSSTVTGTIRLKGATDDDSVGTRRAAAKVLFKTGSRYRIGYGEFTYVYDSGYKSVLDIFGGNGAALNATSPTTWAAGDLIMWQTDQRQQALVRDIR